MSLIIRNVEVDGVARMDVRLLDGVIAEIGVSLRGGDAFDGDGGALIPGLLDHHIHLHALAASAESVRLDDAKSPRELHATIAAAARARPKGAWVRLIGYHEGAGPLTREALDALAPAHRVRVQHRTGALWVLNSAAMSAVCGCGAPEGVDRETGEVWRADGWLRERIGATAPSFAEVGRSLAACGVTAVTDASITTDDDTANRLAAAHRTGELPQRLTLMSGGFINKARDGAFAVGPVKVILDEARLPTVEEVASKITDARVWKRAVAVHCVTAAELAVAIAAFDASGAIIGDRIEHGGVIPEYAIPELRRLGLVVVTQPAFVLERGDRYLSDVDASEHDDLYRLTSLQRAHVPIAGSSDAPYATVDPWIAIRAAVSRRTMSGAVLGDGEAMSPRAALNLYLGAADAPGGPIRRVIVGAPADLCLLHSPMTTALVEPGAEGVRATWIGGRLIFSSDR